MSWRLDSNIVASSSEDTTVRLWEMQNGTQAKSFGAHGGGTLSVKFAKDGRLVTAGRDRVAKMWDQNGGQKRQFEGFPDLATRAVFLHDDASIVAADWSGEVRIFEAKEGKRLGNLAANPPSISSRLSAAQQELAQVQSAADAATRELAAIQADADAKAKLVNAAQEAENAAKQGVVNATNALKTAEATVAEKVVAEQSAHKAKAAADLGRDRLVAIQVENERAGRAWPKRPDSLPRPQPPRNPTPIARLQKRPRPSSSPQVSSTKN